MSNQYYLMSQLPSLSLIDEKSELPVTEEYFLELCSRFLDNKNYLVLTNISLEPPRNPCSTGSVFLDNWYGKERELRLALAQIRALKLNKKFDLECSSLSPDIVQAARTAAGMDSPLAAEQFLNRYRLRLIDELKPQDDFCIDSVLCYGLKLKLALRMKKFNTESGMVSYRTIYNAILSEEKK